MMKRSLKKELSASGNVNYFSLLLNKVFDFKLVNIFFRITVFGAFPGVMLPTS